MILFIGNWSVGLRVEVFKTFNKNHIILRHLLSCTLFSAFTMRLTSCRVVVNVARLGCYFISARTSVVPDTLLDVLFRVNICWRPTDARGIQEKRQSSVILSILLSVNKLFLSLILLQPFWVASLPQVIKTFPLTINVGFLLLCCILEPDQSCYTCHSITTQVKLHKSGNICLVYITYLICHCHFWR